MSTVFDSLIDVKCH